MAINTIATTLRNTLADAIAAAIDGGTGAGIIELFTSGFSLKLAQLTFSDPSYAAASAGVAQENSITDDASADNTGTLAVFRVSTTNDGVTPLATLFEGTAGSGSEDIVFNSALFVQLDVVSITDLPITYPVA